MSSSKSTVRVVGAFAMLVALALAISCKGFFPKATLTSMTLSPSAPSFAVGFNQIMQAWGVDSNSNRYQLTSGVSWTLSNASPTGTTVATIDGNTGTMKGVNPGTITVTASSQGLQAQATATVVEVVTAMTINPTSGSTKDDGSTFQAFTVTDQNNSNISNLVTLTAYPFGTTTGTPVSGISCAFVSTANEQQCIASSLGITTTTDYTILVSYAGYTGSAVTATLAVSP